MQRSGLSRGVSRGEALGVSRVKANTTGLPLYRASPEKAVAEEPLVS